MGTADKPDRAVPFDRSSWSAGCQCFDSDAAESLRVRTNAVRQEAFMKIRTTTYAARTLAAAALLTSAATIAPASPATAGPPPDFHKFRVLCEASDGFFALGFRGIYRCQDSRTDGMGVFWAERQQCENAGRLFVEAFQESGDRGSWVCAPASW